MKHLDEYHHAAAPRFGRPLWVKVCGLTCAASIDAAVQAQVDAIGFVFARSPRQLSISQAQQLAALVPSSIAKVAVMLHPTQAEVDEVCAGFDLDLLQTDVDDFTRLRLPAALQRLPVLRHAQTSAVPAGRFMFEGARSGQGEIADWQAAAGLVQRVNVSGMSPGGLVLAGGLSAQNIAAAIAAVNPGGVDVSSGVELRPGQKDPQKIYEFVRLVRAAEDGASR